MLCCTQGPKKRKQALSDLNEELLQHSCCSIKSLLKELHKGLLQKTKTGSMPEDLSVGVRPERVGDLQDCRRSLSLTQTHLYAIPPISRPLNGLTPQLAWGTVSSPSLDHTPPLSSFYLSIPPTLVFCPTHPSSSSAL
ncbi:hypothetical protein Q8A67_023846 [Cirrhinus molitorella]|uniref:Uncharacterized protein n=1 Tax=Cirrhinus molitorella TaxID=172907 RepID=A0AA88P2U7_9TELE|nr:hypothetical protein Q8A67_023846 [Cirrhinus molitorella]